MMKRHTILLILAFGMMSDGCYNNVFAINGTEQTYNDKQTEEGVLTQEDAKKLIENIKSIGMTDLTIPNGYTKIGACAFHACEDLTSITIPGHVKLIGEKAFMGCSGLTSITVHNGVETIGNYAFSGCPGITSIAIPKSVTSIGDGVFLCCDQLESITIPSTLKRIGNKVFNFCQNLKTINIKGDNITVKVEDKDVVVNPEEAKVKVEQLGMIETSSESLALLLKSCGYNDVKCNFLTKLMLR